MNDTTIMIPVAKIASQHDKQGTRWFFTAGQPIYLQYPPYRTENPAQPVPTNFGLNTGYGLTPSPPPPAPVAQGAGTFRLIPKPPS